MPIITDDDIIGTATLILDLACPHCKDVKDIINQLPDDVRLIKITPGGVNPDPTKFTLTFSSRKFKLGQQLIIKTKPVVELI